MDIDVSETSEVDGRSLTSIAFDRLRSDVIRGELRPGDRLRVHALCIRYGIGATAIREALSRLVTEGLVLVEDKRGFLVMPVSKSDLLDLTETRVDVESLTLTRAIERGDTAWEADLLASYHRLSKCSPPVSSEAAVAWGAAHQSFHAALLAGCGSAWLLTLCNLLYDKSERYRYLANIRSAPQSTLRPDEHAELLAAALRRDATAASCCLAQHYRRTTDIILRSPDTMALFEPPSKPRGRSAGRL